MSVRDATAKRRQIVRNAPLGNDLSTKHAHRPRAIRPEPIPTESAPFRRPPQRGPRSKFVRAAHAQRAQAHLRTLAPPAARHADRPHARGYPPKTSGCGANAPRIEPIRGRDPPRHTTATNVHARRKTTEAQTQNRPNRILIISHSGGAHEISRQGAKKRGSDHNPIPK